MTVRNRFLARGHAMHVSVPVATTVYFISVGPVTVSCYAASSLSTSHHNHRNERRSSFLETYTGKESGDSFG